MKLFFKSYFLLSVFIINLQVHAISDTHLTPCISAEETSVGYAASSDTNLTPSEEQPISPDQAVWKLNYKAVSGKEASGTGFFIAPNCLVTNFHVIALLQQHATELKNIKLLQGTGSDLKESDIKIKKILALSITSDLALLETTKDSPFHLNITTDSVNETQELFSLGYPSGEFLQTRKIGPLQILTNTLIMPINSIGSRMGGSSGSPVLNTENQVVGIITGGSKNHLNLMNAIQAKQLNRLREKSIGFDCTNHETIACIERND